MQKFSSKKKLIHSFKAAESISAGSKVFFLTVIETTYLLYIKWKEFTLFPLTAQKYIELQTFKVIRKMKIAFLKRKNKNAKVTHFKLSHLSDIKSFVQLKWYYKMINLTRCTLIIHKLITAIIL